MSIFKVLGVLYTKKSVIGLQEAISIKEYNLSYNFSIFDKFNPKWHLIYNSIELLCLNIVFTNLHSLLFLFY